MEGFKQWNEVTTHIFLEDHSAFCVENRSWGHMTVGTNTTYKAIGEPGNQSEWLGLGRSNGDGEG